MLKPTIFREYDIRGIADEELLSPDIEVLGQAIGTYIQRQKGKKVIVGRDCRLSSERLAGAIARGLERAGCEVVEIGTVPTPVLYH
ncbi:MAG TPA: phosphomannomutase, partial [Thermopetrobacter sp.]|nr:phosphomannomutase [Thermopetrobacter sp.]